MKSSNTLRNTVAIVFKHKYTILCIMAVTIITIVAGTFLLPPKYEASSAIMVNFGREYIYMPEVGDRSPYNYYDRNGLINTEIEILGSRDLAEKVITTIGIEKFYPALLKKQSEELSQLNAVVDKFDKALSVFGSKESKIIRIKFHHRNPQLAAETVNLLVELFQKKHLDIFRDPKSFAFLETMVGKFGAALKNTENKIETFKKENGAFAMAEQEDILLHHRGDFDRLFKETNSEAVALRERLKSLQEQMKTMSATAPLFEETTERDRVIDNTKAELLTLQLEEQKLLGAYNEDHPKIINVRKRIKVAVKFLQDQELKQQATTRTGMSLAYQGLESAIAETKADLHANEAKSDSLEQKVQEIDKDLLTFALGEQQIRKLNRDLDNNEQNYNNYQAKLEEARISIEMDNLMMTNIRIVHEAVVPHEPVKSSKRLNYIVGVILGISAGLGLAFFKEYISQGINSPEDVERRLSLPVLATINYKKT